MNNKMTFSLADYYPIDMVRDQNRTLVTLVPASASELRRGFFYPSLDKYVKEAQIAELDELTEKIETHGLNNSPAGFIYHMSRCGSTLVSRMLNSSIKFCSVGEPIAINKLLLGSLRRPSYNDRHLKALTHLLCQSPPKTTSAHFIKFSSWNMLHFEQIRRCFPDVPWIFLYRDPLEILVSSHFGAIDPSLDEKAKERYACDYLGMNKTEALKLPIMEFRAKMLGRFLATALKNKTDGGMLVNYNSLPTAMWTQIASHFNLELNQEDKEKMQWEAQFNAKNRKEGTHFSPDGSLKQNMATKEMKLEVSKWITPVLPANFNF